MAPTPILIIASRADTAGGENYLLSCFRYLDRTRYHPIVWLPGDGTFRKALEEAGVEYIVEPVDYGWLRPPKLWYGFLEGVSTRVRSLAELIRSRGITLVHTNSNLVLEGALAAKLAGVPHLYLAHIDFQPEMPLFERCSLDPASYAQLMGDLSAGILAVSGHVRDTLCPPLSQERVTVVHNGLEMARYDEALAERDGGFRLELGLNEEAVIAVAAGRVTADKGFDLLVEAAGEVCQGNPNAFFLICGSTDSPEYLAALEQRIDQLGLAGRIRLLGNRNDLPRVLAQSDIFILSSRREGHPYVLLEAMACGLPAVATRCGGVDETVVEGETGYMVPIGDARALAERIAPLTADSQLRKRMGEAAARRIRKHFTAEQSAQGLFRMYERILEAPVPARGSYVVDLLLQAAKEVGYLGARLTALEERSKKAERVADLILENPLMRLLRRLRKITQ